MKHNLIVRYPGLTRYEDSLAAMRAFTDSRDESTVDEFWFLQHHSVFTQGQAGKPEHLLDPGDIAVVQSDRGGQVTFHGPGQLVVYLLMDIKRRHLGVRALVEGIEQAVISLLRDEGIEAQAKRGAPGVYVEDAKIAALGLRIRRGRTYHGLSLNVDMDLTPFSRINPCGYPGLSVTDMRQLGIDHDLESVARHLEAHLRRQFRYDSTP